jgi:hypothetical protein
MKKCLYTCSVALLVFSACGKSKSGGGGGSAKKQVSEETKTFLAQNVVLGSSMALASDGAPVLDTATKVRPEQILLSDDSASVGRLKSKNLKDALTNEVAPSLSDTLVGTWAVTNIGNLVTNISASNANVEQFDAVGEVSFDTELTATIGTGSVSALGLKKDFDNDPYFDFCHGKTGFIKTVPFLNMLLIDSGASAPASARYRILSVAIQDKDNIALYTDNAAGCGLGVVISKLVRKN